MSEQRRGVSCDASESNKRQPRHQSTCDRPSTLHSPGMSWGPRFTARRGDRRSACSPGSGGSVAAAEASAVLEAGRRGDRRGDRRTGSGDAAALAREASGSHGAAAAAAVIATFLWGVAASRTGVSRMEVTASCWQGIITGGQATR